MPFKVQVGPPQIAIHQGADRAGHAIRTAQVNWPSDKGLYFFDTRLISAWAIYANGEPWDLLNGGAITYYAARIFLTNRSFLTEDGPVAGAQPGLVISRSTRRRHARGSRHHQPRPQARPLQPGDRDPLATSPTSSR